MVNYSHRVIDHYNSSPRWPVVEIFHFCHGFNSNFISGSIGLHLHALRANIENKSVLGKRLSGDLQAHSELTYLPFC